jgi:hypothetical protein
MAEKIYDGGIFRWSYDSGEFTGITDAGNIISKTNYDDFGEKMPRSISVKSHKTGVVKTFELIEIEDNGEDQSAIYRAYVSNVGNVTLCIRNWFDR